ncbi:P-loop containing nucleoside triphosphate hydrolase protein [Mycena pura]|uniref:RNA helicase n=1 Tax=Mycena pura TaxID=153505 RepID=A0AAD6V0N3_9AGAR|nr:P-loop containing nucleoside triphosphate hydrolase protein [Mycena pura]
MTTPISVNPRYCYGSVGTGCELGQRCPLKHDIQKCSCGLVLPAINMAAHMAGKRHRALENAKRSGLDERPQAQPRPNQHRSDPPAESAAKEAELFVCDRCGRQVLAIERGPHLRHHFKVGKKLFSNAEAMAAEAAKDKNSISVSHQEGVDFGVVGPDDSVFIDLTLLKTGLHPRVVLETISMRKVESRFLATLEGKSRWVTHIQARTLSVRFHPSFDGEYDDVLELIFLDTSRRERFLVTRTLHAVVGSKADYEQLKPKSAYTRRFRPAPFQFDGPIIRSLRPPTWGPVKWTSKLLEYKTPEKLINTVFGSDEKTRTVLQRAKQFLPSTFTVNTYSSHFQVLLYIEHEQLRMDLEMYAMSDVELKPNHPRYDLQVKGLEEGRPCVIIGDFIRVRRTDAAEGPWYEGRVHKVHESHVSLRFGETFSTYKGTKFDVHFTLNRLPHRRMHQALTNSFKESRILFPGAQHISQHQRASAAQINSIMPMNRHIADDPEQLETVAAIVHRPRGSVPFVVFGPPGTGKTVTIVEAILQLLQRDPETHILACAPSNSAADLIAQKLTSLGTLQLFRLNALTRKFESLPKNLRKFSAVNENSTFVLPPVEDLKTYRVVVSTCLSGGIPAQLGLKRGHFSHIFIDEAGQAIEPEVILPIKSLANKFTNVVLAGDNKQLGPIVQSPVAASLGLKVSYLSRLMQRDIYNLDPQNTIDGRGITIVKLVKNFRSHPAILDFANQQFYGGELEPCGDPALIRSLENSNELPTKKFPLIFHGIIGKDDREGRSPSFFNISEAGVVKKYVESLLSDRKLRVRPEEIGVITPYHAQQCKIKELFHRNAKFDGITVGSVEEFQGQERRVIIVSTVRSNTNYIESDVRRTLGFVASPHRFNVAITRAQALLIVIGNPDILALDPIWRAFMNYVHGRGGWRGKEISWNPEDPIAPGPRVYDLEMKRRAEGEAEEIMARLKSLIVRRNEGSELDFDISDDDLVAGPDGAVRLDAD